MLIQPKDGFDDLDITSRQQTWIVLLSTEADDECATLTSTPAHTWSAYLCYLCVLPILCRGARARDSTRPVSHQRCLQIRIQLHRHRDRWRFYVKIINGILDRVFDGHSKCIPINQLEWQSIHQIGSQHGRYFMAESLVI